MDNTMPYTHILLALMMIIECRYGVYRGTSEHGHVVALMILGESLNSLCSNGYLLVWELGVYDAPKVEHFSH
jgi:hypothetical protein